MATLNTTTQPQNTTISNIFNIISQLMRITTKATAEGNNSQNNATSNINTRGGHFPYFGTVGVNSFGGFGTFENNNNNLSSGNNNNNNSSPLSLLLLGFRKGLRGGFNPPSGENTRGLDPNVAALVNVLTGANLGINHVERESNHIKLTEFRETEAENPNEWLE